MKTIETNKLIAQFMGHGDLDVKVYFNLNCTPNELKYHKSWDWLMTVVDKIDSIEVNGDTFAIDIFQTGCQVFRYSTYNGEIITTEGVNRLDATYKAVVEFIEWYNEQNKYICGSCGLHVEQVYYDEERDADFCNDCKF